MISYTPLKEAFSIGHFTVYSWGLVFVLVFLLSFFLVLRESKKKRIDEKHIYNISLLALIGAIVGGRLFYVLGNFRFYFQNPAEIFMLSHGGLASYGGIAFALLFAWFYIKKQNDIHFLEILDLFAPYTILAIALGRIGCFLNWCCYGAASSLPWAIKVAGDVPRHPSQIYEMIAGLLIFFIIMRIKYLKEQKDMSMKFRKSKFFDFDLVHEDSFMNKMLEKPGAMFMIFLALYSLFRFATDFTRFYDAHFLGLAWPSQWFCIVIFVFSAAALIRTK